MADANIRINVETSSLEQLNAELSALQAQIAKVPVGSAEFKKLSAEIRRVDGAVEGANRKLKSKGYYDCWSQENLEDIVLWRHK